MRISIGKVIIVLGLVVFSVYLWNPLGTATLDPRARLLGIMTYSISAASMAPTLEKGDYVLVKTFAYTASPPEVGDIIVFEVPDKNVHFVKRVIAKAGDKIALRQGVVMLNGKLLDESYTLKSADIGRVMDFDEVTVPESALFVLGDNRDNSLDSRHFGFVNLDRVVGKVFYIWLSDDADRVGEV